MHVCPPRSSLLATAAPTLALSLALAADVVAQSAPPTLGWSGWLRCEVTVRGPGYTDQQTHTWTMPGGTPTVAGAFRVYPATWSVVGSGGLQRTRNDQSLDVRWSTNGPALSAPIAVFVRASDGKILIQSRHTQLRAPGAIQGYQLQTIDGKRQPVGVIALEAFEWAFPLIEVTPATATTNATASGSRSQPTTGSVGPMQPDGSQGSAACTWQFAQGRQVAAPPAVVAGAVPTPPAAGTIAGIAPAAGVVQGPASGAAAPTGAAPTGSSVDAPTGSMIAGAPSQPAGSVLSSVTPKTCALAAPSVKAVATSPASIELTWAPVSGATGYTISRSDIGAVGTVPASRAQADIRFTHRADFDYRVTYSYTVSAQFANGCGNGQVSIAAPRPGTPTAVDLRALEGSVAGKTGRVRLEWRMPDTTVSGFVVLGPGLGQNGQEVPRSATPSGSVSLDVDNVPSGAQSWLVTPYWTVPGGRVIDVSTGLKLSGKFGIYRIAVTGVRADKQTADDPFDVDGVGDEIYVAAAAYHSGRFVNLAKSAVYGDTGPLTVAAKLVPNPPTRQGRVMGGTQTPTGGVKTGDVLPSNPGGTPGRIALPLIVWEGWLGGTALVRVNPTVWEFDGNPTLYVEWNNTVITANGGGPGTDPTLEAKLMEKLQKAAESYKDVQTSTTNLALSTNGGSGGTSGAMTTQTASNPPTGSAPAQAPQLPPFMLAGQQGWDRYIGELTVFPPLAFSADGVQAEKKLSATAGTVTFRDTPAGPFQNSDAQYTVTVDILPVP
jgi:hypothetical protein